MEVGANMDEKGVREESLRKECQIPGTADDSIGVEVAKTLLGRVSKSLGGQRSGERIVNVLRKRTGKHRERKVVLWISHST